MSAGGRRLGQRSAAKTYISYGLAAVLAIVLAGAFIYGILTLRSFLMRDRIYNNLILETAARHNIDPSLLKAVIWMESRFNPTVRGGAGECGLMQIKPSGAVADWVKINNINLSCEGILFIPELNLEIGAWYLGRAIKKWGAYKDCIQLALCEYNAGGTRAYAWRPENPDDSMINNIKIPSTKKYVSGIIQKYEEYRKKNSFEK